VSAPVELRHRVAPDAAAQNPVEQAS